MVAEAETITEYEPASGASPVREMLSLETEALNPSTSAPCPSTTFAEIFASEAFVPFSSKGSVWLTLSPFTAAENDLPEEKLNERSW